MGGGGGRTACTAYSLVGLLPSGILHHLELPYLLLAHVALCLLILPSP